MNNPQKSSNYNLPKTQLIDNPHCRLTIICEGQRGGAAKYTYYAIAMYYALSNYPD